MIKEADRMPIVEGLEFYIEAFNELATCRAVGMDMGPIPFTSIYEYSKIYDVGDFDEFLYVIRKMDNVVMSSKSKERKPNGPANSNTNNQNRSRRKR